MSKYLKLSDVVTLERVADIFHKRAAASWVYTSDVVGVFIRDYREDLLRCIDDNYITEDAEKDIYRRVSYRIKKLCEIGDAKSQNWGRKNRYISLLEENVKIQKEIEEKEREKREKIEREREMRERERRENRSVCEDLIRQLGYDPKRRPVFIRTNYTDYLEIEHSEAIKLLTIVKNHKDELC